MFDESSSKLRWFLLPSESYTCLHSGGSYKLGRNPPFTPVQYPRENPVVSKTIIKSEFFASGVNVESQPKPETRESFQNQMISSLSDGFNNDNESCGLKFTVTSNESKPFYVSKAETSTKVESCTLSTEQKRPRDDRSNDDRTNNKVAKLSEVDSQYGAGSTSQSQEGKEPIPSDGEKRKFVCEGKVCFTKRTTNASDHPNVSVAKYRWCNPPKHIFKPTVQVQYLISVIYSGEFVELCYTNRKLIGDRKN